MNCVVCLETNADIFSRIGINTSEWRECNIQRIIEKHLWWWYLRMPQHNDADEPQQWICRQCWQELSSFHNFYLKVENGHKQLKMQQLMKPVLKNQAATNTNNDYDELLVVKQECPVNDRDGSSLIEVMEKSVEKRAKRGRGKKKANGNIPPPPQIHIEELPAVVVVKNESDLFFTTGNLDKSKEEFEHLESSIDYEIQDITKNSSCQDDIWEPEINISNNNDDSNDGGDDENIFAERFQEKPPKRKRETKKAPKSQKKSKFARKKPMTKNEICKKTQVSKKNDEFLAENLFELTCSLCNVALDNFSKLKLHYRQEHDILGHVICCNRKFFKRGMLVDHLRVHKDPNYFKCPHCDRILANRGNFENHIECHKAKAKEPRELKFSCDKCEKSFFKKVSLERHQLLHIPEDQRQFECNECGKKFATGYLRKQHIALTHTCKYAKICDICGKLLRDKFSFIRHMAEHNGATPAKVPCDICGVELTNKYLLNRHKKKLHTVANLQEQVCPYCSKVSPNLSAHRHHVVYSHTLERKHACHMCDKKFKRPKELREHLSTHTGEALYTCPHCPRTFISNGNMHKHRKLSHRQEWEAGRLKKLTAQQLKVLAVTANQDSLTASNYTHDGSATLH